jgi:hypothetical protein
MNRALRLASLLALVMTAPLRAADPVTEDVASIHYDNSIQPELSEEGRIFTGQDVKPLTPDNFSTRMDGAIEGAKSFASFLGPEIWALLIAGFGLVGFVIRRTERVLNFDTEKPSRRTDHPEHSKAGSGPDASNPPHSDSDPAPSARPDPVE